MNANKKVAIKTKLEQDGMGIEEKGKSKGLPKDLPKDFDCSCRSCNCNDELVEGTSFILQPVS